MRTSVYFFAKLELWTHLISDSMASISLNMEGCILRLACSALSKDIAKDLRLPILTNRPYIVVSIGYVAQKCVLEFL